jgi:hypothetical protein
MKTMKAMKINAKKAMKAKFKAKAMKAMKAMKAKPKANIASKAPSFQIFIEVALGKTITVVVKGADTVDQLKAKIQDNLKNAKFKKGSSSSNLVVRLDQPWMGRTLADYGLKQNSIVTLAREFTTNEEEKVGKEFNEGEEDDSDGSFNSKRNRNVTNRPPDQPSSSDSSHHHFNAPGGAVGQPEEYHMFQKVKARKAEIKLKA